MGDQILTVPFYYDWKFWSVVVSGIAIILSQLPPIHILLRRAKIEVEAYSRVHITHAVGNPNAQLHLIISNTGGRRIKIKEIKLHIRREGDTEFVLPAQNYLQKPTDKTNVLFTSFKLKPKEDWAYIVNFFNLFSREDERNYRQLESNLRIDIIQKRDLLENKGNVVTGDDQNVQPLVDFFENKFKWLPGEYVLRLEILTLPEKASLSKRYRITLFESDSNELKSYRDDYKYGFGICMNYEKHSGLAIPLSEI